MTWTTPKTWAAATLSSSDMNLHLRDQLNEIWPPMGQLVGFDTAEYTMASVTEADMVTITPSPSITVDQAILIRVPWRKTTGAAATVEIGLKLNSTIVWASANCSLSDGANQAAGGFVEFMIPPRSANYLAGGTIMRGGSRDSSTGVSNQAPQFNNVGLTALMPNATITAVVIRGRCSSASITLGIKDIAVYAQRIGSTT